MQTRIRLTTGAAAPLQKLPFIPENLDGDERSKKILFSRRQVRMPHLPQAPKNQLPVGVRQTPAHAHERDEVFLQRLQQEVSQVRPHEGPREAARRRRGEMMVA